MFLAIIGINAFLSLMAWTQFCYGINSVLMSIVTRTSPHSLKASPKPMSNITAIAAAHAIDMMHATAGIKFVKCVKSKDPCRPFAG